MTYKLLAKRLTLADIIPVPRGVAELWMEPVRTLQPSLFDEEQTAEDIFAEYRVSVDEIDRWHKREWLSFDSKMTHLLQPERDELMFVRNLAHFGLSDAIITRMLSFLEKPYQYSPFDHAFCFAYGWVSAAPELDEETLWQLMESHFANYVQQKVSEQDTRALHRMRFLINSALTKLDEAKTETE